jgi:CubicO group peptidase (beta-lactamase class C family)
MRVLQTFVCGCLGLSSALGVLMGQSDSGWVFREERIEQVEALRTEHAVAAMDYAYIDQRAHGNAVLLSDGSAKRRFHLGSLGKVIVAMGVMQLVEHGKLQLEDAVALYLPELKMPNPWQATDPVRIVHLLEHSSGLDEMHFNEYYLNGESDHSLAEALARNPAGRQVRWRPGSFKAYSNVNYAIAARVIEIATGQEADKWLMENVLKPMGMRDSYFDRGQPDKPSVDADHGYDSAVSGHVGEDAVDEHPYLYYPAVGFVSTANDMGRLMAFLLNEGHFAGDTVLQASSVQRMMRPGTGLGSQRGWWDKDFGLGFRITGNADRWAASATGYVAGFGAELEICPPLGMAWVVMGTDVLDRPHYWKAIWQQFRHLILYYAGPTPTAGGKAPAIGHYRHVSIRNALFAFEEDIYGDLEVTQENSPTGEEWIGRIAGNEPFKIVVDSAEVWESGTSPRFPAYTGQTVEGKDYLVIEGQYYERMESTWPRRLRMLFEGYKLLIWLFTASLPFLLWFHRGRRTSLAGHGWLALTSILTYWTTVLAYQMLTSENYWALGQVSAYSLGLAFLSICIPALALVAAWFWWKGMRRGGGRWITWANLPLILGNFGFTVYLMAYRMLPFFSWRY